MKKILKVDDPNVYAKYVGAPELHPQLALISYDEVSPFRNSLNNYGVYGLFIQQQFPKYLSYGTKSILVGERSIIAVAPGQIGGGEDNGTPLYINGWALLWSPEFYIPENPFFSYFDTDWLRMEPQEWERISLLLVTMRKEMQENRDSTSLRKILTGYLQLILDYCQRIYLRQLTQQESGESDILKRFHRLLVDYFPKVFSMKRAFRLCPTAHQNWLIRPAILAIGFARLLAAPPSAISIPSSSTRPKVS